MHDLEFKSSLSCSFITRCCGAHTKIHCFIQKETNFTIRKQQSAQKTDQLYSSSASLFELEFPPFSVRATFARLSGGRNGSCRARCKRFTFLSPIPGQRTSSCSLARQMPPKLPKTSISVITSVLLTERTLVSTLVSLGKNSVSTFSWMAVADFPS